MADSYYRRLAELYPPDFESSPVLTDQLLTDSLRRGITFADLIKSGVYVIPDKYLNPPTASPEDASYEGPVKPVLHLPGHNYQGPGNNLVGQPVYDVDDSIAKEHDEFYSKAISPQDIEKADKHFIHDSISDVLETGNPHSIIGGVGIGIKHLVEKVTGPIYPGKC